MTCESDWESRHEQDFIQVRPEKIAPDWVRPVVPDQFTGPTCNQITIQGMADIGTADCAQADRVTITNFMQYCPLNPTSVAGITISGCMVAGTPKQSLL